MRGLRGIALLIALLLLALHLVVSSPIHAAGAPDAVVQADEVIYLPAVRVQARAFAPTIDTILPAGDHQFTSFTIPAGVTVTVASSVTVVILEDAAIEGLLTGVCAGITLRGQGDLLLTGQIRHSCDAESTVAQDDPEETYPTVVRLVFDGAVQIGAAGQITPAIIADGSIFLTDSATEAAPFTPIDEKDHTPLRAAAAPQRVAQSGPLVVDAAIQPTKKGDLRLHRDGDVTINAVQVAPNGADAAPTVQAGTCNAATQRGLPGGTISLGARDGTLRINANLTAGNGGKGGNCTAPSGCPAIATAGPGGRGGSILVGGKNVFFAAGVTLTRGSGGAGGDAVAQGDDGAAPCDDGCDAITTAGAGGRTGGIGYVLIDPGQIVGQPNEAGGNGGRGGDANSTAGNGRDCDKCPDGKGGDGGIATATAGMGGDGASGNIWPVVAGSHRSGDGGDATGIGGNGGQGADCCDKFTPQKGGDGGKGGDANVNAGGPGAKGIAKGNDGASTGKGGNGGAGGDGTPPGAGGVKGGGFGAPDDIDDGVDGQVGDPCPVLTIWFVYYSSIPDGLLAPGVPITLNTYITTSPSNTPTGQVVMRPQTQEEFGSPVQYTKDGDDIIVQSGGLAHDLSQLPDFPVIGVQARIDHQCEQVGCVNLVGLYQGQPVGQVGNLLAQPGNETLLLPPPEDAPVYDSFILVTTVPIRFNHWWIAIIDP